MKTILLIIICVLMAVFAIGAFILAQEEKKRRKQTEKKIMEAYERENKAAEIITESNKTKAAANTGNINNDINFMANKLHDYANK